MSNQEQQQQQQQELHQLKVQLATMAKWKEQAIAQCKAKLAPDGVKNCDDCCEEIYSLDGVELCPCSKEHICCYKMVDAKNPHCNDGCVKKCCASCCEMEEEEEEEEIEKEFRLYSYQEQLAKCKDPSDDFGNVWRNHTWTIADYEEFFEDIDRGYVIQGGDFDGNEFVINEDYEE